MHFEYYNNLIVCWLTFSLRPPVAQLAKLQSDMEALREQRENTISNTRDELYSAQEEVLVLRHAMEAAMAERERDIAALQADLSAVTAELDKWRKAASKYELEISTLQESFKLQSQHQERALQLQGDHSRFFKILIIKNCAVQVTTFF